MIGDWFGIQRPFEVAFFSFLVSTTYVFAALPHISPDSMSDGKNRVKGIAGFFSPLKVLAPQRLLLEGGSIRKHFGVLFLCCGVFLGVVSRLLVAEMSGTAKPMLSLGGHRLRASPSPAVCNRVLRVHPRKQCVPDVWIRLYASLLPHHSVPTDNR